MWVGGKHVNKRDTVSSLPSHFKNSDFLYSLVHYSDFANNPNKDEIKLLQPRSQAFGRGVASTFSGAGALRPWLAVMTCHESMRRLYTIFEIINYDTAPNHENGNFCEDA